MDSVYLVQRVERREWKCMENHLDPMRWKRWARALLDLADIITEETYGAPEIRDAITKLRMCLELSPYDIETKLMIGESLVKLMFADVDMSKYAYAECCNEALECFNEVLAVCPELVEVSRMAGHVREYLYYLRPSELREIEDSKEAKQACKDNSGDAKNWEKWVMSLVRLRDIMDETDLDKDMLTEAKKKLRKALKVDAKDLGLMWSLGEVYMLLVSADSSIRESEQLYKKHCDKAIRCFDDVRLMDNDFGRGSTGPYIAQQGLEYLIRNF